MASTAANADSSKEDGSDSVQNEEGKDAGATAALYDSREVEATDKSWTYAGSGLQALPCVICKVKLCIGKEREKLFGYGEQAGTGQYASMRPMNLQRCPQWRWNEWAAWLFILRLVCMWPSWNASWPRPAA